MSEAWRECEVTFPNVIGSVSGCTIEQPDTQTLAITMHGDTSAMVIDKLKALPKRRRDAFKITVVCMGGQVLTANKYVLKKYQQGESIFKRAQIFPPGENGSVKPHVFIFHRFS